MTHNNQQLFEAEIADGLSDLVVGEMREQYSQTCDIVHERKNLIQFMFSGPINDLMQLKTVIAVYRLLAFDISRPKALLGHQNFHILLDAIKDVFAANRGKTFKTFSLDAAGSGSSVMQRIMRELAAALELEISDKGDLHLRIRRSYQDAGWDVLIRLSPRPLATRYWRICNYEGALNASVAQAMIRLLRPKADDTLLNIACGSGSLMIEAGIFSPGTAVWGCDLDPAALTCAAANIEAAGLPAKLQLMQSDARRLPLCGSSVDVLTADLPFGQLTGSHNENRKLYPAVLAEAARVAKPDARFALITHEIRLMESLLERGDIVKVWQVEHMRPITLSGLHPRIYLLRKV